MLDYKLICTFKFLIYNVKLWMKLNVVGFVLVIGCIGTFINVNWTDHTKYSIKYLAISINIADNKTH